MSLCECGCGLPTLIAKKTRSSFGQVKGKPLRFLFGHNFKVFKWPPYRPTIERFTEKYIPVTESGCWIWLGATIPDGYGSFRGEEGRSISAHRFAYEYYKGPIRDGLELDHLCRVRLCVNPYHLEAVDHKTNILRGEGLAAVNARKTHCVYGHELTPDNCYGLNKGRRNCKTCSKEQPWRVIDAPLSLFS